MYLATAVHFNTMDVMAIVSNNTSLMLDHHELNELNIIDHDISRYGLFAIYDNGLNIIDSKEIKSLLPDAIDRSSEAIEYDDNNVVFCGIQITFKAPQLLTIKNINPEEAKNIFVLPLVHISDVNHASLDHHSLVKDYHIGEFFNNANKYYLNYMTNNNMNSIGIINPQYLLYIDGAYCVLHQDIMENQVNLMFLHRIIQKELLPYDMTLQKTYEQQENKINTLSDFKINGCSIEFSPNITKNKKFQRAKFIGNYVIIQISDMLKVNPNSKYNKYYFEIYGQYYDLKNIYNHDNQLGVTLYYKKNQKNKYYISYKKSNYMSNNLSFVRTMQYRYRYKHIMINENYEPMIIEYNIEKGEFQVIKDWRMHFSPKDIKQIQLSKMRKRRLNKQIIQQLQNKNNNNLSKAVILKQQKQERKNKEKIQQLMMNAQN